ncbi:PLP-dependent transferase [Xylaria bambusicola]|uniref:PLP-dependent transferase n=1 Tax=Xylaria bambusicola TaxID=326684 RepID=UPI002007B0FB|nr:PLP-dependent transferase [Xylaria bambusicola]KAI0505587.1 PLP-dependent transferase [Xylaria bambusicola]
MSSHSLTEGLEATLQERLGRRESQGRLRQLHAPRTDLVDFSSNDYLSFSQDKDLRKAVIEHLTNFEEQQPPSPSNRRALGSGGSRLLDGNSEFVEYLEKKISSFHGSQSALLFNSAYDANVGLISCVPGEGDVIIYDDLIHASIHDGMKLSRATRKIPFAHSSILRNASRHSVEKPEMKNPAMRVIESLGLVLKQLTEMDQHIKGGSSNVFICVEALYSMDGDIADLEYVSAIVKSMLPKGNGYIIVDEAHSVGVLGDGGRGLVCQLGLQDQIWARVIGFGKAVGCAGGAILCSSVARLYLINYARTFIYTTAMSFPSLASINVAYDFLITGKADKRRNQLKLLVDYCHKRLKNLDQSLQPTVATLRVLGGPPCSPIIPLFTSYPKSLSQYCKRSGFMVRPIVAPTVPLGQERIRICIHATNTIEQIDNLCRAIEKWLSRFITRNHIEEMERGQTNVSMSAEFRDSLLENGKAKI